MTLKNLNEIAGRLNGQSTDADWAPIFQAHDELVRRVLERIRPGDRFDLFNFPPTTEFLAAMSPDERALYDRLSGLIKWSYSGGWKIERPVESKP